MSNHNDVEFSDIVNWKNFGRAAQVLFFLFLLGLCLVPMSCTLGWFSGAANLVQEQTSPKELLRKYEWFKDASARLDAINQNVLNYQEQIKDAKKEADPDRWDKQSLAQLQREYLGVKQAFNNLAAEYNAAMSKFNYQFCNAGTLPQGATVPLPREFKPYQ